jgi:hypothetical protein
MKDAEVFYPFQIIYKNPKRNLYKSKEYFLLLQVIKKSIKT